MKHGSEKKTTQKKGGWNDKHDPRDKTPRECLKFPPKSSSHRESGYSGETLKKVGWPPELRVSPLVWCMHILIYAIIMTRNPWEVCRVHAKWTARIGVGIGWPSNWNHLEARWRRLVSVLFLSHAWQSYLKKWTVEINSCDIFSLGRVRRCKSYLHLFQLGTPR